MLAALDMFVSRNIPTKCSDLVRTAPISELKSARKSERSDFPDFQKGEKNLSIC